MHYSNLHISQEVPDTQYLVFQHSQLLVTYLSNTKKLALDAVDCKPAKWF